VAVRGKTAALQEVRQKLSAISCQLVGSLRVLVLWAEPYDGMTV
jgi:hypothetical protein